MRIYDRASVSWWAGNKVTGFGVFRPDEPVIEYADEVGLR